MGKYLILKTINSNYDFFICLYKTSRMKNLYFDYKINIYKTHLTFTGNKKMLIFNSINSNMRNINKIVIKHFANYFF